MLVSTPAAQDAISLYGVGGLGSGISTSNFVATFSALSADSGLYIKSVSGVPLYIESSSDNSYPFVVGKDGRVGIGTKTPNTGLTVIGNISATGSLISRNNYYLPTAGTTITTTRAGYFGTVVNLDANSRYELEYNLYFKNGSGTPKINYALSASNSSITFANANFMQDLGGSAAVSTGTKVGGNGTLIDMGTTETVTALASAFGIVKAMVTTSSLPTTVSLVLSCDNTSGITPLAGSYRKVTLFS